MLSIGRDARQRPAPPTPKSCSDQPKALWLAICANRIRVSLTNIVARGAGSVSRAYRVSIGVRPIFSRSLATSIAVQFFNAMGCFRSLAIFFELLLQSSLAQTAAAH
jgi:hypothetical protein